MSGYSPIETLARLSGEAATIVTPLVGDSRDYKPSDVADFAPSSPQSVSVSGIWSDGYEDDLQDGETAVFLIPATSLPAEAAPARSHLVRTATSKNYLITRIRERTYLGAIDGYNLFLGA